MIDIVGIIAVVILPIFLRLTDSRQRFIWLYSLGK